MKRRVFIVGTLAVICTATIRYTISTFNDWRTELSTKYQPWLNELKGNNNRQFRSESGQQFFDIEGVIVPAELVIEVTQQRH